MIPFALLAILAAAPVRADSSTQLGLPTPSATPSAATAPAPAPAVQTNPDAASDKASDKASDAAGDKASDAASDKASDAASDNDEKDVVTGRFKLSLPTESDREAWLRDGFRLGLGAQFGEMFGLGGVRNARVIGAMLRLGLRLDADWSIFASFQYEVMSRGISGLRFSGTIDPTWHVTPHLSLALGLGFGGISGGSTGRADVDPLPDTLASSYTFPSTRPTLPTCTGGGVAALARVEWAVVVGKRASTTFALESFGQWTGCSETTGLVEPDTGQAIVRRQFWPHVGVTGSWGFMWR